MDAPLCFTLLIITLTSLRDVSSTTETRVGARIIPEKVINGVIDIVQSHKNKPSNQNYPQTYPQYQTPSPQYQWGQTNQNQAFQSQYQGQYSNPSYPQNNYNQAPNYPQNYPNQGYTSTASNGFSQNQQFQGYQNSGQQGQYQASAPNQIYQNQGSQTGQYQTASQTTGHYQNQGALNQYPSGQYQTGQVSTGQYQNQISTGQYQNPAPVNQGYYPVSGGTGGQFQATGAQSGGQVSGSGAPTCICQAWTKPTGSSPLADVMSDTPVSEKSAEPENITQATQV